MKLLTLSKGLFAKIDDHNFEWLSQWKWCADDDGYAVRSDYSKGKKERIRMHRLITNCPLDLQVDHINGDRSDNQETNLRVCTVAENARWRNSTKRNSSGFRGVSWAKRHKSWKVTISVNGNIFLGYFRDKDDAARAYDNAAKKYHGAFASLNFKEENPI